MLYVFHTQFEDIYYFKAKIFDDCLLSWLRIVKNFNSFQMLIFNKYINNELMTMVNN